jgi:hypothetical protein
VAAAIHLIPWLTRFCEWHDGYKRAALPAEDVETYLVERRDLCLALLMAQRLAIEPGATAREALRVARAYQVEFSFATGAATSITKDISTSGLSALVGESPPVGSMVQMRLKLGEAAVIVGRCQVVNIIPRPGSMLMCVAFQGMPADARDKLETVVCDVVVSEIRSTFKRR